MKNLKVKFGWRKNAGLVAVYLDQWAFHFLVQRGHWFWGHDVEEYDCAFEYYGWGPLFLLVKV
jgi:hypothetical protein